MYSFFFFFFFSLLVNHYYYYYHHYYYCYTTAGGNYPYHISQHMRVQRVRAPLCVTYVAFPI